MVLVLCFPVSKQRHQRDYRLHSPCNFNCLIQKECSLPMWNQINRILNRTRFITKKVFVFTKRSVPKANIFVQCQVFKPEVLKMMYSNGVYFIIWSVTLLKQVLVVSPPLSLLGWSEWWWRNVKQSWWSLLGVCWWLESCGEQGQAQEPVGSHWPWAQSLHMVTTMPDTISVILSHAIHILKAC